MGDFLFLLLDFFPERGAAVGKSGNQADGALSMACCRQ
jgi:hypothetical protein